MKQIKILGVLAIALALGLSACGGNKQSSKSESKSETPSSVVPSSSSQAPASSSESSAPSESSESSAPSESSESSQSSSRHVHTFDETVWESNDTNHWHPATCEHTTQKGSNAKHEFVNVEDDSAKEQKNEAPTCTEKGHQWVKCTICGKEVYQEIKANGHSYQVVAPEDDNNVPEGGTKARAATCTVAGVKVEICSVCNDRKESEIPTIDHTFAKDETTGEDVVVWSKEANCTEGGEGKKTCTVCGTEVPVTAQALGHEWGEWEETLAPTCTKAGSRKHTCSRCGAEASEEVEALGHDTVAIGGETQAPEGEATVRLYKCNRCNETFLGFKADEPSTASLPHLMVGDNGGMRFFGRPIGNSLALDANGKSVNEQNNECVYCSTETGDFFEYIFTLNAEQAATLSTCRLYCDARPADHLSGDFWAYGRSATDWTPGYYIDGAADHIQYESDGTTPMMVADHARAVSVSETDRSQPEGAALETQVAMGARIEDFRYVLYVDDQIQQLDADISVPAKGSGVNMTRDEYVVPFTFHLHEGQNKISLRMAGGYRSEFYNFIFRPYVEPTPITVNETAIEVREGKTAQITSAMEGLTYKSSNTGVATVAADGTVTGVKAGTATITVSKEGNFKDAKVPVTVLEKEGIITLNLDDGVLAPEGGAQPYHSSYSGDWLNNFAKDTTLTYTFQSEKAVLYDIQLGLRGAIADLSTVMAIKVNDADVAVSGSVNSNSSAVDTIVGQANLKVGENTMVITILAADSGLYLKSLKLMPHQYVTVKAWSSADIKAGITEGKTLTEKDFGNSLPEVKGYKFNNDKATVTLTVEMEAAGTFDFALLLGVKKGNQAKTGFWYQVDSTENPLPAKDKITVNETDVVPPENDVTFEDATVESDQSDNGTLMVPVWKTVCQVSLQAGSNTIVISYLSGGYSLYLCGAQLLK